MKLRFERNIRFVGIEVILTHELLMYYDTIYSINKSEAWYMTTISSYILEFSFYPNFYIICNK